MLDRVHLTPGDPGTEQAVVTLRHHGAVGVGTAPGTDAPSIAAATLQAIRVIVDGAVGPDAAAELVGGVEVVEAEQESAAPETPDRWEGRTRLARLGGWQALGRARDRRRADAVARSTLDATNRALGDLLPD